MKKNLIRWLWLFFAFFFFQSSGIAEQWYPGIIHVHSTFSDGDRTPAMLKNAAVQRSLLFMIVEDHDNQIPTKKKLIGKITDDYGYDKYFRDFSTADSPIVRGTDQHLICIAGAEVNAGKAHLLILQKRPMQLDLHPGQSQEEVISLFIKNNVLFGIAHPCNKDYPFDFGAKGAGQARGFEIYNGDYVKTLKAYLDSEAPGKFVFTGSDSHTSLDVTDLARWAHITQVWVEGRLTDESLVEALRNGQTVATNDGAYIKKLSPLPQTGVQEVEGVSFDLVIGFGLPIAKTKKVKVYRDKQLCSKSIASVPIGTKEYRYQWKDTSVSEGVHEYFIVVDDECLVTSPIKLRIKGSQPPPPVVPRPSPETARYYRDLLDEQIKADLRSRWQKRSLSTRLIMLSYDKERVRNFLGDRRVVQMLVDLSRNHVLALRIKTGYENDARAITREGELTPEVSAHYDGQAFDIFYADGVEIAWQVSSDTSKRQAAQKKTRELLKEILTLGRRNPHQLPTQILVFYKSDLTACPQIRAAYGYPGQRGLNGAFSGPQFWDRIHIGY